MTSSVGNFSFFGFLKSENEDVALNIENVLNDIFNKNKTSKRKLKKCNLASYTTLERLFIGLLSHDNELAVNFLIKNIPTIHMIENGPKLIRTIILSNVNYDFGKIICSKIIDKIKPFYISTIDKKINSRECPLYTAVSLEEMDIAEKLIEAKIYNKKQTLQKILYLIMQSSNKKLSLWFYNYSNNNENLFSKNKIMCCTLNAIEKSYVIEVAGIKWLELNKTNMSNHLNNLMKTQGFVKMHSYKGCHYITETGRFDDGFYEFLSTKNKYNLNPFIDIFINNINPEKHILNNIKNKNYEMANYLLGYANRDVLEDMHLNVEDDDFQQLIAYPELKSMISKKMLSMKMGNMNKSSRERIM